MTFYLRDYRTKTSYDCTGHTFGEDRLALEEALVETEEALSFAVGNTTLTTLRVHGTGLLTKLKLLT